MNLFFHVFDVMILRISVVWLLLLSSNLLIGQEKFPWPEGKKFAISLSFDDSRLSNLEHGIPLFNKHGIQATFYVHPSIVEKNLSGWKDAVAKGHEMGNHTLVHPCSENFIWSRSNSLESYTLTSMRKELTDANRQIKDLLGVTPVSFAYTCGQTFVGKGEGKKSYVPLIAELFTAGRGWLNEAPVDPLYADLAEVNGIKMDDIAFEDIMPMINYARDNNLWLVLVGHDTGPQKNGQTTRLDFLEKLCTYINDNSDIWAAPVGEVARYVETTRTNGRLVKSDPLPVIENVAGTLNLKASLGRGYGPKIEYMPDWKAYGWWTSQDSVVWNISVPESASYKVMLEWSISDEEAGKEVSVHIGGNKIVHKIQTSGSWETFRREKIGEVSLPAGNHKVIVVPTNSNDKGHFMDVRSIQLFRINN
ncbi:polysaccharide deacetylase family protein [Sphingobacterium sp. UT-1RO-CII-1]|uniref:polysaccharide deacetylase family protein n=1 Tax=Sphingobacterium sp. UT-1RO-CII-1 TaxID=2995225 RepID=UPI00227B9B14|nr:polysaccharide deacetylase family protein [Sphingobacterium sp. UT-1RO-CII-1]MCY4778408.1 polysaccharide deacetylase family protein [Sphingobacterium sp. UT-1RO-CII-1]